MSELVIKDHGFCPVVNGTPVMAYMLSATKGGYSCGHLFNEPPTSLEVDEFRKAAHVAIRRAQKKRETGNGHTGNH